MIFARAALILLALLGAWSAWQVSFQHFIGEEACPKLGPSFGQVPACYVVLAGYAAIVLAGLITSRSVFLIGWIPVFALAGLGVSAELLSASPICPQTANGVPKCYFSLAIAALIGVLGWLVVLRPSHSLSQ